VTDLAPPVLTMPETEAEALRAAYGKARVVLEYGSGGSTVIAAAIAGARVFSVESDAEWVAMMQRWFDAHPAQAKLSLVHADIGPTKEWGMPVNNRQVAQWAAYPTGVWDRDDFEQPDVVLIDGRFRLACFLTVAYRTKSPVTVLWDDYAPRPPYHEVERLVKPTRLHGRMAEFHVTPQTMRPEDLGWIAQAFARPQ
jgi:hypothetical protein